MINGSEKAAGANIAPALETFNLEGIWTFSLEDASQMTGVLYQSGNLIWGASKSEKPEPMNSFLSGSISGNGIEISALSSSGDVLTLTRMRGTMTGETISGGYFQIDSLGVATSGSFAGFRTSSDTAGYSPLAAPEALATATDSQSTETEVQPQTETVDETTSGATDVHQLSAGINPRILGYAAPVTGKTRIV